MVQQRAVEELLVIRCVPRGVLAGVMVVLSPGVGALGHTRPSVLLVVVVAPGLGLAGLLMVVLLEVGLSWTVAEESAVDGAAVGSGGRRGRLMVDQGDVQLVKGLSGDGGVRTACVHQGVGLLAIDLDDGYHGARVDGGDLVDLLK